MFANFFNGNAQQSRFWDYPSVVRGIGSLQLVRLQLSDLPTPKAEETLESTFRLLETILEAKETLGSGSGVETRKPGGRGSPGRCSTRWEAPPVSCLHKVGCSSPLFLLCSLSSEKQVQASALTECVRSAPLSFCPISKCFMRKVELGLFSNLYWSLCSRTTERP